MLSLFRPALAIFGAVLLVLAVLFLIPICLALIGEAPDWRAFLYSAIIGSITGVLLLFFNRESLSRLNPQRMFLITFTNWIGVSLFAALPFLLSDLGISFTDAVFESVSGITTTGSTVLSGLDAMPKDILLWRSITQWLGGIGIIGMAVAILPFLRIGGMRLFQTESSDWSDKAMPRARKLLVSLVVTYLLLSLLCMSAYALAGMGWFDAINHGMTTIATGGYSTSDASLGHFAGNRWIQWVAVLFMIIGAMPFVLYIRAAAELRLSSVLHDSQVKAFLVLVLLISYGLGVYIAWGRDIPLIDALTLSFLNVVSVITTTGYASDDYGLWGASVVVIFFFITFVGGCSGSTSGGIKIFRFQIFFLILYDQLMKSIHPRAVTSLRYNNRKLNEDVISSSIAFMFVAMAVFCVLALVLGACGLDIVTSLSGALTAIMNVGPGLGDIIGPAGNFQSLPATAKWALCLGMLMGRLEFLTVIILFSRLFWRG